MYTFFFKTVVCLFIYLGLNAQSDSTVLINKNRFAFGGAPVLSYDSDIGLRIGAAVNLFDHGIKNIFPLYEQFARLQAYKSTKGVSYCSLLFESESLFSNVPISFESVFADDIAMDFWGFNGINSLCDQGLMMLNFYKYQRRQLRVKLDAEKSVLNKKFRCILGGAYENIIVNDFDFAKIDEELVEYSSLFQKYKEWGVIEPDEMYGGNLFSIKTGLKYDSRDSKINSKTGLFVDSYLVMSTVSGTKYSFTKFITTVRQFFAFESLRTVLAYRASGQFKLSGEMPFFALPVYYDLKQNVDGMGGAFTVRGIFRNRIIADSYVVSNVETRSFIARFKAVRLNWEIYASSFTDAVYVAREHAFSQRNISDSERSFYFKDKAQKINATYGLGLYVVYNSNNILSASYGRTSNYQLGNGGIYIGSAFLF